ncbi:MAG: dihydrofolate reductase family protein [Proteobacteria bacterium]|nr:dihydrofolate reductase family protein [Pseudomonadota bacterium]
MTRLYVRGFSLSLDGFGAGPAQDLENPLGRGGKAVHQWVFETRFFRRMTGQEGGRSGVDDDFVARGFENIGAWILGRNMFGPVRGAWPDESWRGWWGEEPPYHSDVYVLTHHARAPLKMAGGTTFYFVTEGIRAALERATQSARGRDVRLGGGVATVREYLRAGLIDEMHLAVAPVLLGSGEHFFNGIDLPALNYECVDRVAGEGSAHFIVRRR